MTIIISLNTKVDTLLSIRLALTHFNFYKSPKSRYSAYIPVIGTEETFRKVQPLAQAHTGG